LTPGVALCEACFDIAEFQNNGLPASSSYYVQFCDDTLSDDWWFLGSPAKDATDLSDCCAMAQTAWDNGECDFSVTYPGATARSCAYNIVYNCMNISATWPNPAPYPAEPQPQ